MSLEHLKNLAGEQLASAWPDYYDTKIKDIPEDELIDKLNYIEAKSLNTVLSTSIITFYDNACLYLGREKDI